MSKNVNIEPIALGNAAANLLNPNVTSLAGPVGFTLSQPFLLITHMHFCNVDAAPHSFSIFKGITAGSAAATALFDAKTIGANDTYDYYPGGDGLRLDAADFLTGLADVANKVILSIEAEINISG